MNPPVVRVKGGINVVKTHRRGTQPWIRGLYIHKRTWLSYKGHYGCMQMANAALRTLNMPVDNFTLQPISAPPGHFQTQFLTVWQCDWWRPRSETAGSSRCCDSAVCKLQIWGAALFSLSLPLACRGHNFFFLVVLVSPVCHYLRRRCGDRHIWTEP